MPQVDTPGRSPGPSVAQVGLGVALVTLALAVDLAAPRFSEVTPFLTLYLALSLVAWLVPFRRVLYPLVVASAAFANWAVLAPAWRPSLDWTSVLATVGFVLVQGGLGALIIERSRLNARLALQNAELARSTEFESLIRSIVSHDLRNPLGSVRLGVEVLVRRAPSPADREVLERIDRSAMRAQKLALALLDVARMRGGQTLPLEPVETDLVPLLRHVVDELPGADRVGIDAPGTATGIWDPERLEQALSNLVGNALQHSPDGSRVEVVVRTTEPEVRVQISNQGEPISPELLPHLFAPFGRMRTGASSKGSLGLGLFITRSIAEAHGGGLELASTAGSGTTFLLRLPRLSPSSAAR